MSALARSAAAVAVLAVLSAATLGCGEDPSANEATDVASGSGSEAPEIDWATGAGVPEGWSVHRAEVVGLAVGTDPGDRGSATTGPTPAGATLSVTVRVDRARLDDGTCAGEAGGWATDEGHPEVVWASVQVAVPDPGSASEAADEHGPCPSATEEVELDPGAPLAGRDVMIDGVRWVPSTDGYGLCELPACDPETGAAPATATCDDVSSLVDDVRETGDVPRHAGIVETRCEGRWAMVEVDIGSAACGSTDGGPNPCAGVTVDRLFLRAGSPRWEVITRTREAGCASVGELEPDYPSSLCADRPAL